MVNLIKGIRVLVLFMLPVSLDVVSCGPRPSGIIKIYQYDGENYTVAEENKITRYHSYSYTEYDEVDLEGYEFLGWIETRENKTFKTLEELQADYTSNYMTLVEKIEGRMYGGINYYPILVESEKLENFLDTSPIAKVTLTVVNLLDNKINGEENYEAKLLDKYSTFLSTDVEIEGYDFVCYSLSELDFENNVLDLNSKIEKHSKITVYAHYKEI